MCTVSTDWELQKPPDCQKKLVNQRQQDFQEACGQSAHLGDAA